MDRRIEKPVKILNIQHTAGTCSCSCKGGVGMGTGVK